MANLTLLRGLCPAPFFDESEFPSHGGYIPGRLCSTIPGPIDLTCCLPCPAINWVYPESFYNTTRVPGYVAIASLVFCAFLLLAFLILPPELTKRHYLNTCLILSIVFLELGLAVPVLAKPDQCLNEITPNDMNNNMTCAWAGGMIVFGGCSCAMWILARVISMHLQICWDMTPSRTFFYSSQLIAWGAAIAVTTVSLVITGVSFRFGDYCHVNSYKALDTLWGPLLGVSGLAICLQAWTTIFCIKVYIQSLLEDGPPTTGTGTGTGSEPSQISSSRRQTTRAVYRRIKRVFSLQWRSLAIAALVAVDVIYLAIVFVVLNARLAAVVSSFDTLEPWVLCIITKPADQCLALAVPLRPSEAILIATLVLIAIVGIQCALLISRKEMLTGWYTCSRDWYLGRRHSKEFVSLDAANMTTMRDNKYVIGYPTPIDEKKEYELLEFSSPLTATTTSPLSTFPSPIEYQSPPTRPLKTFSPDLSNRNPHHGNTFNATSIRTHMDKDIESAITPTLFRPATRQGSLDRPFHHSRYSFSSPRPPSSGRTESQRSQRNRLEWDASSTFARPGTTDRLVGRGLGVDTTLYEEREGAVSRLQR